MVEKNVNDEKRRGQGELHGSMQSFWVTSCGCDWLLYSRLGSPALGGCSTP
jgi:hypothetical protein